MEPHSYGNRGILKHFLRIPYFKKLVLTGILVGGIDPTNGNLKTGRPSWPTAESLRPGTCANLHPREIVRLGSVLLPEGKVPFGGGIPGIIFETVKKWCPVFVWGDELIEQG